MSRAAALEACARGELSLRDALGLPPESVDTARALAARLAAARRLDLARVLLEGAVALESGSGARLELAQLALREAKVEEALEHARRALESGPMAERGEAAFLAARACLSLGRRGDAGGYLRIASEQASPPAGLPAFSERLARR